MVRDVSDVPQSILTVAVREAVSELARAVIDGDMTLGMMTAMQYIIGQLNAPISQFIGFVQEAQDAKISLERLGEIQERGDEESVTIPHDRVTAIVGASGSGKTTMVRMMLGFYEPVSGEVLLGGRRIGDYSPSVWREQCGTVMQEGFVFSDTIADNIGVSDESPDMERVRQAVETANIGEFIDGLPLRYNTKIGAEGNGVSTGQKQRLLIARAAYRDARYLFLDEATNSLDANNEKVIMERLDTLFRGKTVVIVAHRLSTVRNADNIIVLDRGRVVEQGTHRELTERILLQAGEKPAGTRKLTKLCRTTEDI